MKKILLLSCMALALSTAYSPPSRAENQTMFTQASGITITTSIVAEKPIAMLASCTSDVCQTAYCFIVPDVPAYKPTLEGSSVAVAKSTIAYTLRPNYISSNFPGDDNYRTCPFDRGLTA